MTTQQASSFAKSFGAVLLMAAFSALQSCTNSTKELELKSLDNQIPLHFLLNEKREPPYHAISGETINLTVPANGGFVMMLHEN